MASIIFPALTKQNKIMEDITHRTELVNGINMHVAELGAGDGRPVILFIHGFPELWYSWRHQMVSLAARGYHAVAPDLRGYGDTDAPSSQNSYTVLHIVGDLVALIQRLGVEKVFVVGHDWGAVIAWWLCMLRPDMVKALVNMSIVFSPRNPACRPVDSIRAIYGEEHYICRFQESDEIEAEFARFSTALLLKKFLGHREPAPYFISKEKGLGDLLDSEITTPPWLSEEDLKYYESKFEKSGFIGGLYYYRCLNLNWELTAPWTGAQIKVPVKFMVGDLDLAYHTPGVQNYLHNGGLKKDVPFLEEVVVMQGVGHFINQERPQEVSDHIYDFIQKF